jgi:hypothetical protein
MVKLKKTKRHLARKKPYTAFYLTKETSKGVARVRVIGEKRREEYEKRGYTVESFRTVGGKPKTLIES